MKFDVILTNPPFQDSVKRKRTPHKLWIDFTNRTFSALLKDGGHLCQVSPASFGSPSNRVLSHMRDYETLVLRLEGDRHFPGVTSSFADYLIRKVPSSGGLTRVFVQGSQEFQIRLDSSVKYLPNDLSPESLSIHQKVMFDTRSRLQVEWDYVAAHNIRRYDTFPTLSTVKTREHRFPVLHTNRTTWWSSIRQSWANDRKVMWSRSGYTKPFFDDGVLGGTDMVYFVRVGSRDEGQTLAHNMNLKLMTYVYRTARWSGFGNERVFAGLPNLPRSRKLTDTGLYRLFKLDAGEVRYVEEAVGRDRYES